MAPGPPESWKQDASWSWAAVALEEKATQIDVFLSFDKMSKEIPVGQVTARGLPRGAGAAQVELRDQRPVSAVAQCGRPLGWQ